MVFISKKRLLVGFLLFVCCVSCAILKSRKEPPKATKVEEIKFVIDASKPMVAITYDDGPHEVVTKEILDTLQQYRAHATFFMIGDRISHHGDLVKRMIELGCELGNHTFGHQDLSQMGENEMSRQLERSENAVETIVGAQYRPKIVRPPFGNTNQYLQENCPYPLIVWSIDTRDWSHQNVERSVQEVMNQVQDGDIILMHDMYEATAKATAEIVRQLSEKGFQLLTVSEMFEAKGIVLEPGKVYHHAH